MTDSIRPPAFYDCCKHCAPGNVHHPVPPVSHRTGCGTRGCTGNDPKEPARG